MALRDVNVIVMMLEEFKDAGIVYRFSNDIGLIVKVNCNITLK